ncbi:MAG TPA: ATP-grasp domain-containing protein [Candidatus Sulfotelmatobacter sp.]|nr:ATP-grasp domain-containing protein [Candidatus Sulfotelmatobacter sp.]
MPHLVWLNKGSDVPAIPDLPDSAPLVCYGPGFVTRALNHPRLRSGLFFDPATFCWSAFRTGWEDAMLSYDGRVMTLRAARNLLHRGGAAFVRPDSDSKAFEGAVYDASGLDAVTEQIADDALSVAVASPVSIEAEWRFFVVGTEIVGCSEYRRWGQISTQGSVPHTAIDLAGTLASRWSPADIYCLDLAISGDRIGVVEANCFNASRFYSAVTDRILRAVNAHVLDRV